MSTQKYDLVVIGSGPAGQKAGVAAAKVGRKVAVIDRREMIGGISLHHGTIPSKTLREAVLYLTGFRQRAFYGSDSAIKDEITTSDLQHRIGTVVKRETEVIKAQLRRNGITTVDGLARFSGPHSVTVETAGGDVEIEADFILISCGTRPAREAHIPFDGRQIFDADDLLSLPDLPRELIVVGAGVIGLEYASMFTALGIETTIIDQRARMLEFADAEIVDRLCYHLRDRGATFRMGEKVASVERDERQRVVATLESGKRVRAGGLLYTVGRLSNADKLHVESAGLSLDERGRLAVNEHFQTAVPHIYAAGDVIGFPALAATSMDQGRRAACNMFGVSLSESTPTLPYGVYTLPEISMVGQTEQQLTANKIPYDFGVARYDELAKGQIVGDHVGYLKLLFSPDTRAILGVHALGENAAELIHIGQAVMHLGGTIEYFRDSVFNYPTFAEAYKVAALDGLNKL